MRRALALSLLALIAAACAGPTARVPVAADMHPYLGLWEREGGDGRVRSQEVRPRGGPDYRSEYYVRGAQGWILAARSVSEHQDLHAPTGDYSVLMTRIETVEDFEFSMPPIEMEGYQAGSIAIDVEPPIETGQVFFSMRGQGEDAIRVLEHRTPPREGRYLATIYHMDAEDVWREEYAKTWTRIEETPE
jgi:hypothetical protein